MKSSEIQNEKIVNESESVPNKSGDVSGNDQIIVNVTQDPTDLSEVISAIEDVHYQNTEMISILQSVADRPSVTPTILYSLFFLSIVLIAYFSKK